MSLQHLVRRGFSPLKPHLYISWPTTPRSAAFIQYSFSRRWRSSKPGYEWEPEEEPVLDPFPESLRQRYHPDFIRIYDKYITSKDKQVSSETRSETEDEGPTQVVGMRWEDVNIKHGANGKMAMRIHYPPLMTPTTPIVIHYPSFKYSTSTENSIYGLSSRLSYFTSAIVVTPNLSHAFPTAIHDALSCLDWTTTNLTSPDTKIAVVGEGMGAGIALTVGATEGQQGRITAIGAWTPLVDWTFDPVPFTVPSRFSTLPKSLSKIRQELREYGETRDLEDLPRELKEQLGLVGVDLEQYDDLADNPFLSSQDVQDWRKKYLPDESTWVDPFASPMYFFKHPGVDTALPPVNPWASSTYDDKTEDRERIARRVKEYPPLSAMPFTLPFMRIVLAGEDVLRAQGEEFAKAVKASVFPKRDKPLEEDDEALQRKISGYDPYGRYALEEEVWTEEVEEWENEGDNVVKVEIVEGAAHGFVRWTAESVLAREEVEKMAGWMKEVLQEGIKAKL